MPAWAKGGRHVLYSAQARTGSITRAQSGAEYLNLLTMQELRPGTAPCCCRFVLLLVSLTTDCAANAALAAIIEMKVA